MRNNNMNYLIRRKTKEDCAPVVHVATVALPRSAAAVIGLLGSSLRSPSGSAELASLGQSSPFFLRLPCDFTAR